MEIKFYNTYLPIISADSEIVIPVTNSKLNISFRLEMNEDNFNFYDYSCYIVLENKAIQEFIEFIPNTYNELISYLENILNFSDDIACLYYLSLMQALNQYLKDCDLQDKIINNMKNKTIGLSFVSGNIYINNVKYLLQEGMIAMPCCKNFREKQSKILLLQSENLTEKLVEKVFFYNNLNIVIYDSAEINDFHEFNQELDCEEVICL
ncbi:hypothetical protein [Fluviispira multicolorata]|uniref:Uncharacterized protein n=1 Tax=Fluviispira multicolorata TaxID=2654512 RepID=A0A833JBM2_9BACT|nr:hypothetical protein [Fluviispira multicolorata]KAB8028572.1 hypothetical protein GCL57_12700 [Fluviispira multicolorata]